MRSLLLLTIALLQTTSRTNATPHPYFERVYGLTLDELEKAWWEKVRETRELR